MKNLDLFLDTLGMHPFFQTPWKPEHGGEVPF